MRWKVQKCCFTYVKHIFSRILLTDSGVTFWCHLGHFRVALDDLGSIFMFPGRIKFNQSFLHFPGRSLGGQDGKVPF